MRSPVRVVDSSAWIEWLVGSPTGELVAPELPEPDAWLIPTLVQFELARWLTREAGEMKADQAIAFTRTCEVVPLDTALAAAEAARVHRLATAQAFGATLLTSDRHFEGLPGVTLIGEVRD